MKLNITPGETYKTIKEASEECFGIAPPKCGCRPKTFFQISELYWAWFIYLERGKWKNEYDGKTIIERAEHRSPAEIDSFKSGFKRITFLNEGEGFRCVGVFQPNPSQDVNNIDIRYDLVEEVPASR